jgi:hypothetical protein
MNRAPEPGNAAERGLLLGWLAFHREALAADICDLASDMVAASMARWHDERRRADQLLSATGPLGAAVASNWFSVAGPDQGDLLVRQAQQPCRPDQGAHRRRHR